MKIKVLLLIFCLLHAWKIEAQNQYISVDGAKICFNTLNIENRKPAQPLIVFESGLGTPMGNWDTISDSVAKHAPILTYDRPGIGASEPDQELPTIKNVADKLVKLLDTLNLPPPYVLVGHSFGAALVRGFAVYYPELLAGLVIIDPADFTETAKNKREYYELFGWTATQIDQKIATLDAGRKNRNSDRPQSIQEERDVLEKMRETDFKEIQENPLPNIPVHIIVGGRFDYPKHLWSKEYDEEALFRSKMRHRVARWTDVIQSVDKGMLFYSAGAGHFVHRDDPELVISSIKIVLQAYLENHKKEIKAK